MKPWTLVLSGSFAGAILLLAVAAGWRAAPAPATRADTDASWWNGTLTREFESHYDAVFPVRTFGINTWGAISYLLFREGKPGVVVGADGWLYTSEEFKVAPDADAQVAAHLAQVATVRERLAAQNVALLVALVPAKARVEAATLGGRTPPPLHAALYGRALDAFRAQGIAAPDLDGALRACKSGPAHTQVFLRTDTHWTPAGARCVADALATGARAAKLAGAGAPAYRTTVGAATPHRGDLLAFLPLDPWFARLLPPADSLLPEQTEPLAPAAGLLDDAPAAEVVLVGTSYSANPLWNFTGALQQAFAEDVVSYATPAHGPFLPMLEYLDSADFQSAPPRLVIWEMPERYLPMRDGDGPASAPTPNPSQGKST